MREQDEYRTEQAEKGKNTEKKKNERGEQNPFPPKLS